MSGSGRPERTVTRRKAVRNNRGEMPSIWSSCMTVVKRGLGRPLAGWLLPLLPCGLRNSTMRAAMRAPIDWSRVSAVKKRVKAAGRRRVQVDFSGLFLDRDRDALAAGHSAS